MNDRDTQKAAAEDLQSIVQNLEPDGLPVMLSCLCTTGPEQKVFARKECARAIGVIASEACPVRDQALQPPHLSKILGQIRKSLQDSDSSVREATSEALAAVAQGLAALSPAGSVGSTANPVLKLIADCLAEQKREINAAACAALGMAAPYLGTLDGALAKELVRKAGSAAFQAPAALLAALARTDPVSGEPQGLVKSGPAAFLRLLPALLGQPAPPAGGTPGSGSGSSGGGGVLGALSRPDWPVRMAAADMLRALALLLGPLMEVEGCWAAGDARCLTGRAMRALEACRFDKVRDVRDVARAALGVLEDLHSYGGGGGSAAGWPAFAAERLQGRGLSHTLTPGSPKSSAQPASTPPYPYPSATFQPERKPSMRRASPTSTSPGRAARPRSAHAFAGAHALAGASPARRSPPTPERRASPGLQRASSLSERFRAAHSVGDSVADPLARFRDATDVEADQPGPPGRARAGEGRVARPESTSDGLADRALSRGPSRAASTSSRAAAGPLGEAPEAVEPEATGLSSYPSGDGGSGGNGLTGRASGGSGELVASLRHLGPEPGARPGPEPAAGPASLPGGAQGGSAPSGPAPSPAPASTPLGAASASERSSAGAEVLSAPHPHHASAAPHAHQLVSADSPGATITLPTAEWAAAQERLRALEAQQRRLLEALSSLSDDSARAITGLQEKVRSLEAALEAAQSQLQLQASASQLQLPAPAHLPAPPAPAPLEAEPLSTAAEEEEPWMPLRTIRPRSPLLAAALAAGGACGGRPAAGDADAGAWEHGGGGASQRVSVQLPPPASSPRAGQGPGTAGASAAPTPGAATDARAAYREALAGGRASGMHLLRLMQRTGPVWDELGHELATQLLAAFTTSLQQLRGDGPLLPRMLPWLWRLADDEHHTYEAPQAMRVALLAALRGALPSVTDPVVSEKVGLLISTLQTHWLLPESPRAAAQPPAAQHQLRHPPPQQQPWDAAPLPAALPFRAAPQPPLQPALPPAPAASANPTPRGDLLPSHPAPQPSLPGPIEPSYSIASVGTARPPVPGEAPPPSTAAAESQQPAAAPARVGIPRGLAVYAAPSMHTLRGQLDVLERDFAAMNSPGRALGRGAGGGAGAGQQG